MHETPDEIAELQRVLDDSYERAGPHLRSIVTPAWRMTAEAACALLTGTRHVALATTTAAGAPLVSPVDALFLHGRFHALTERSSLRARHLRARPAVSVTYFETDLVALTAHGTATLLEPGHPDFPAVDEEVGRVYGSRLLDWTPTPVVIRVEPRVMVGYDRRGVAGASPP